VRGVFRRFEQQLCQPVFHRAASWRAAQRPDEKFTPKNN